MPKTCDGPGKALPKSCQSFAMVLPKFCQGFAEVLWEATQSAHTANLDLKFCITSKFGNLVSSYHSYDCRHFDILVSIEVKRLRGAKVTEH
jgi:hypothetical protein